MDLVGRVADRLERFRDGDGVVDGGGVVGHDREDDVARVEERQSHLGKGRLGIDHHGFVQASQDGDRLLHVARRDHLGHLHARGSEQDVDPGRIAPHHIANVRLLDPIRRQIEDRRHVIGDFEEGPQVAVLEAAVNEGRRDAQLTQ